MYGGIGDGPRGRLVLVVLVVAEKQVGEMLKVLREANFVGTL